MVLRINRLILSLGNLWYNFGDACEYRFYSIKRHGIY